MTTYETLVFLHVVAAAVWVGAGVLSTVLLTQVVRSGDDAMIRTYSRQGALIGPAVFAPASIALIAFGLWAALDLDWDLGATWITIGFVGWAIGFVLGLGYHGPVGSRLKRAIAEEGPTGPRAARLLRQELAVGVFELIVVIIVVWAMVAKPG
jgi:uncharacterized membrane protein